MTTIETVTKLAYDAHAFYWKVEWMWQKMNGKTPTGAGGLPAFQDIRYALDVAQRYIEWAEQKQRTITLLLGIQLK